MTGIIVPWNYPLFLAVSPLTAALAAGNRVMVKMSEYAPLLAAVFQKMIAERFEENHVAVVWGGADVGMAFTGKPFDHVLFTGSTDVGRHVMRAASDHLTPVTSGAGWQVTRHCQPRHSGGAGRRTDRVRQGIQRRTDLYRAGLCAVSADRMAPFLDACKTVFAPLLSHVKENPDYTAIINDRQHARLQEMLRDAEMRGATVIPVNPAGEDFTGSRKMPLYLVRDCTEKMRLLQEEIFGPVLPVVPYDTPQQAVDYVNDRPRPLALYYFGYNRKTRTL